MHTVTTTGRETYNRELRNQRSLVRFTGALIADGGLKLLLDGKRGAAANDGGSLE